MQKDYRDEKWIGQKFNRLTVIAFEKVPTMAVDRPVCSTKWIVRCDCGTLKSVYPYRVLNGNTKSCGCFRSDLTIEYNKSEKVIHGGRKERLYTVWTGMKSRCYTKTSRDYPNWGGRGIVVCDEWKNDYSAFKSWALSSGYKEGLSLDRINVNGNYEPSNCRWADWFTQARNRSTSIKIKIDGEEKSLVELAKEYGIKYGTLYQRVHHYGWDIEKALTFPIDKRKGQRKPNVED